MQVRIQRRRPSAGLDERPRSLVPSHPKGTPSWLRTALPAHGATDLVVNGNGHMPAIDKPPKRQSTSSGGVNKRWGPTTAMSTSSSPSVLRLSRAGVCEAPTTQALLAATPGSARRPAKRAALLLLPLPPPPGPAMQNQVWCRPVLQMTRRTWTLRVKRHDLYFRRTLAGR